MKIAPAKMPTCDLKNWRRLPCAACRIMFTKYCFNLEDSPCFDCLRRVPHYCKVEAAAIAKLEVEQEEAAAIAKLEAEERAAAAKRAKEQAATAAKKIAAMKAAEEAAIKKAEQAAKRKVAEEAIAAKEKAAQDAAKKAKEEAAAANAAKMAEQEATAKQNHKPKPLWKLAEEAIAKAVSAKKAKKEAAVIVAKEKALRVKAEKKADEEAAAKIAKEEEAAPTKAREEKVAKALVRKKAAESKRKADEGAVVEKAQEKTANLATDLDFKKRFERNKNENDSKADDNETQLYSVETAKTHRKVTKPLSHLAPKTLLEAKEEVAIKEKTDEETSDDKAAKEATEKAVTVKVIQDSAEKVAEEMAVAKNTAAAANENENSAKPIIANINFKERFGQSKNESDYKADNNEIQLSPVENENISVEDKLNADKTENDIKKGIKSNGLSTVQLIAYDQKTEVDLKSLVKNSQNIMQASQQMVNQNAKFDNQDPGEFEIIYDKMKMKIPTIEDHPPLPISPDKVNEEFTFSQIKIEKRADRPEEGNGVEMFDSLIEKDNYTKFAAAVEPQVLSLTAKRKPKEGIGVGEDTSYDKSCEVYYSRVIAMWMGYCLHHESMLNSFLYTRDKPPPDELMFPGGAALCVTEVQYLLNMTLSHLGQFDPGGASPFYGQDVYTKEGAEETHGHQEQASSGLYLNSRACLMRSPYLTKTFMRSVRGLSQEPGESQQKKPDLAVVVNINKEELGRSTPGVHEFKRKQMEAFCKSSRNPFPPS